MRKRSTTIDADSEEEYFELMKSQELTYTEHRFSDLKNTIIDCYNSEYLGFASNSTYQVKL